MLATLIALVGAAGGCYVSWLLLPRAVNLRSPHLIAWSISVVGLTVAFLAAVLGGLLGYGSLLFRVVELGAALLGPGWLATGTILLVSRHFQVRFLAWLLTITFMIVAVVILSLDPLMPDFTKAFPHPGAHYERPPSYCLNVTYVVTIIAMGTAAVLTMLRARDRDREALALQLPVALLALAALLMVIGSGGYLGGTVGALGLAAGLGLFGYVLRGLPDGPVERGAAERPVPPRQREQPPDEYYGESDDPWEGQRMYGQITVFTLVEGRGDAFDRMAAGFVQAARTGEPDLLVFSTHDVAGAANQRIFYQLFRDRAAFEQHQRLPHVRQFLAQSRPTVSATNVIELALNSAKVMPLPSMLGDPR